MGVSDRGIKNNEKVKGVKEEVEIEESINR